MSERPTPGMDAFSGEWARAHLPSYGPEWERAIDFGVDVVQLLENLALTPTERLQRLQQAVAFHEEVQASPFVPRLRSG